jgi:hypothetical protein
MTGDVNASAQFIPDARVLLAYGLQKVCPAAIKLMDQSKCTVQVRHLQLLPADRPTFLLSVKFL